MSIASDQEIPCPHCNQIIDISGHGESIECPACRHDFVLAWHTCPDCYHYHDEQTAVCQQCATSINRTCRQCSTSNWGGDESCQTCGNPLDIFELMYTHSEQATPDRLGRHMSESQAIKLLENEASEQRMAEFEAIEVERQTELYYRLKERQKRERLILMFIIGIIAVFLIFIIILTLSS